MFRMTYDRQNEKQQSYIINYIVAYGQCIHVISNFWSDELTNTLIAMKKKHSLGYRGMNIRLYFTMKQITIFRFVVGRLS